MTNIPDDDAFVERIARPLRASEQALPDFDVRVMARVVNAALEPAHRSKSWWTRPRTFRLTPLSSLALAAGIAAIVFGAGLVGRSIGRSVQTPRAVTFVGGDTVRLVRFVFVDSTAVRVALVGAFNQWRKDAILLEPMGVPGVWSVELPLRQGRHEYAFVVLDTTGERWVADPLAPRVRDEFGTESSVVTVKPRPAS